MAVKTFEVKLEGLHHHLFTFFAAKTQIKLTSSVPAFIIADTSTTLADIQALFFPLNSFLSSRLMVLFAACVVKASLPRFMPKFATATFSQVCQQAMRWGKNRRDPNFFVHFEGEREKKTRSRQLSKRRKYRKFSAAELCDVGYSIQKQTLILFTSIL